MSIDGDRAVFNLCHISYVTFTRYFLKPHQITQSFFFNLNYVQPKNNGQILVM